MKTSRWIVSFCPLFKVARAFDDVLACFLSMMPFIEIFPLAVISVAASAFDRAPVNGSEDISKTAASTADRSFLLYFTLLIAIVSHPFGKKLNMAALRTRDQPTPGEIIGSASKKHQ